MKHLLLTTAALMAVYTAMAHAHAHAAEVTHAQPCTTHPPAWAVVVERRHSHFGKSYPEADDPIWQHAMCDADHHTVEWQFP